MDHEWIYFFTLNIFTTLSLSFIITSVLFKHLSEALLNDPHKMVHRSTDDKLDKSIGVYNLKREGTARTAIGGVENSSYRIKSISILIHWNRSVRDTEKVSEELFNMLRDTENVTINGTRVKFTDMKCLEPIPVDTDDKGIFEFVIELA